MLGNDICANKVERTEVLSSVPSETVDACTEVIEYNIFKEAI